MKELAAELRSALNVRDMVRGREVLLAYRSEFDRIWSEMSEFERQQSSMPREAIELLNWARTMALLARQEFDSNRQCLRGASKYLDRRHRAGTIRSISI
jgi:hypothetical protein